MFGLPSLSKLLILVAAVLIVWYGFKLVWRLDATRKAAVKKGSRAASRLETVECPRCGVYVAAGSRSGCVRDDCPLA